MEESEYMVLPQHGGRREFCVSLLGLALAACSRVEPPEREGRLLAGAFADPAVSLLHDGQQRPGFAHEFLQGFAQSIGVPLQLRLIESFEEMEMLLRSGQLHIGAFLNAHPPPPGIVFSKPVSSSPMWVVGHADSVVPRSLSDLHERDVHVNAASPAEAALKALPPEQQPRIISAHEHSQQELLTMVANRQIALAAVDEIHMRVAANFQPDLQPAVTLFGKREYAFAFPEALDKTLRNQLEEYVDKTLADGSVMRLYDSYYGHIQRLSPALVERFLSDIRTLLPRYRAMFRTAQDRTGIDWRLIAALAYQESKWDPLATSFTNVRGMMMLTEDTADMLGVENRLDPAQSIRGGADYLQYLTDQLPESVTMPDRLWQALAAYNLGMGHLNGGRAITRSLGKDPDNWYELKTVLPLLTRPEYYQRLKSGRARGGEAVILVENIRNLQDILTKLEPAHSPSLKTTPSPSVPKKKTKTQRELPLGGTGINPSQVAGFKLTMPPK
jgi:membrane-bound lytic murein transglycosylase F